MLVTDETWAERHPVKQAVARPYRAWRCVAFTEETLNFLIVASHDLPDGENLPDGWLVDGPEALLAVAAQLQAGTFSVLVMDRVADAMQMYLRRVTAIWREREARAAAPSY